MNVDMGINMGKDRFCNLCKAYAHVNMDNDGFGNLHKACTHVNMCVNYENCLYPCSHLYKPYM